MQQPEQLVCVSSSVCVSAMFPVLSLPANINPKPLSTSRFVSVGGRCMAISFTYGGEARLQTLPVNPVHKMQNSQPSATGAPSIALMLVRQSELKQWILLDYVSYFFELS